ncbi:unnamed protein product [Cylicocyclus nassatus]|uniref:Uncharacterized protein n=1 Tax=Cylicocyclus nassatus TaxID=53992 RepID=A0AA36DT08_CYLNA|nr:unnamed protein product [Cylicocyclus nassatus]
MDLGTLLLAFGIAFILVLILRWFIELFVIRNLESKAVFITGCDSGFGRDLAIRCAEKGMPVFAGCLFEKSISEYQELSRNFRIPIDAFIVDVTKDDSVTNAKRYLEYKTKQYGGLHGVVNNAGILGNTFFDDFLTLEDYKNVAEVNTWGVIRVTHALKPLVKKTRGRIVTVTSICSRIGLSGIGPYTTAKAELRSFGVSVHILEPGFFNTWLTSAENVENQLDELYNKCTDETKSEYGREFYVKMRQKTTAMLSSISSNRIDYVTDAYFHALTAVFPRSRYQVGWDSILVLLWSVRSAAVCCGQIAVAIHVWTRLDKIIGCTHLRQTLVFPDRNLQAREDIILCDFRACDQKSVARVRMLD